MVKQVVRVAISNNFNCSSAEFNQLSGLQSAYPEKKFFVNCNINTAQLLQLKKHNAKAVITANPSLTIDKNKIEKLYTLKSKISFVRVKWLPENMAIQNLIKQLSRDGFKVVITNQRFNSVDSLLKFTNKDYYKWENTRYRLIPEYFQKVCTFADSLKNVFICDRNGTGCQGCNLCVSLNNGANADLAGINLSTSGVCKFNCPDCYAKAMQHFLVGCGKNPIEFDTIKQNKKQAGLTKHIKDNLAK